MDNQDVISHATTVLPAEIMPETGTKSRRGYKKSGLYAAKAALKQFGDRAIDGRTGVAKALDAWRSELIADLGGKGEVSAMELSIIDMATKTKLLLDSLDVWLLQQSSLINSRKRSVYPVVLQRQQLADALARYMKDLGLERRAKPVKKTLTDMLATPESSTPHDV
ncbi:MAG TPA: hypothetical protein VJ746_06035 [Nitrospira sp.]|nr:hypothetical protein [Nitrospira sp.]